jgi:hypothetical protein
VRAAVEIVPVPCHEVPDNSVKPWRVVTFNGPTIRILREESALALSWSSRCPVGACRVAFAELTSMGSRRPLRRRIACGRRFAPSSAGTERAGVDLGTLQS